MKSLTPMIALVGLLLITLSCNPETIPQCSKSIKVEQTCSASFDIIHPTQFVLGMRSIPSKRKKVEKKFRKGEIEEYLLDKVAPAIIGPNGVFYIADRHHTSYSIYKAKIDERYKKLYLKVAHDWSHLSDQEFAQKMIDNNFTWLRDEKHIERDFYELPSHISELGDDPYRSLAWKVREEGGFQKVDVNFLEFFWGMFFKDQGIILTSSSKKAIKAVLPAAMELARSEASAHLPGHIKTQTVETEE